MGQSIQTGLTQSEVVSSVSGSELQTKTGSSNSSGGTLGTVPTGKVWKIYTVGLSTGGDGHNYTSFKIAGAVKLQVGAYAATANANTFNLGSNYILATAGQEVSYTPTKVSGSYIQGTCSIGYVEEDA